MTAVQRYATREEWLAAAVGEFSEHIYRETGKSVPAVRVGVGFPSAGMRSNVIGECWTARASADGTHEIVLRMDRVADVDAQAQSLLDVLLHEVIHAVAGIAEGHGKGFKAVAVPCGLTGKMTATTPTDDLRDALRAWVAYGSLGAYPMATFNPAGLGTPRRPTEPGGDGPFKSGPPTQGTRMLKAFCGGEHGCGYTLRLTRKWATVALPECPNPECERQGETMALASED